MADYMVWHDDWEECDARRVNAYCERAAAEEFVRKYESDGGEYYCANGGEIVVHVRGPSGIKTFDVSADTVIVYHAGERLGGGE